MSSNMPIIDALEEKTQGGRPIIHIPFIYWSFAFHLDIDIEEDSKFRLSN
jgi:hypothetical protein